MMPDYYNSMLLWEIIMSVLYIYSWVFVSLCYIPRSHVLGQRTYIFLNFVKYALGGYFPLTLTTNSLWELLFPHTLQHIHVMSFVRIKWICARLGCGCRIFSGLVKWSQLERKRHKILKLKYYNHVS